MRPRKDATSTLRGQSTMPLSSLTAGETTNHARLPHFLKPLSVEKYLSAQVSSCTDQQASLDSQDAARGLATTAKGLHTAVGAKRERGGNENGNVGNCDDVHGNDNRTHKSNSRDNVERSTGGDANRRDLIVFPSTVADANNFRQSKTQATFGLKPMPTIRTALSSPSLLKNKNTVAVAGATFAGVLSCTSAVDEGAARLHEQLKSRLSAIDSSNLVTHKLMTRWKRRIDTLAAGGREGGNNVGVLPTSSPSLLCESLLAELEADVRKAAIVSASNALLSTDEIDNDPILKGYDDLAIAASLQEEVSAGGNQIGAGYGPFTLASLEERKKATLSRLKSASSPSSLVVTDESYKPLTVDHQEDIKAMVAASLLSQYFAPRSAEGLYQRLLTILVDAAFRPHSRAACPNANLFTFVRGCSDDNGSAQSDLCGGGGDAKTAQQLEGDVVRRSYRELYNELTIRKSNFHSRPERVMERLGAQKSRFILRVVFLAWRAGYRRRAQMLYNGFERSEFLYKRKCKQLLGKRFGQWRRYVQVHGKHKRVLQYHGSREKLIQRLARRVTALEGEKHALEADLANIREDQVEVQEDLISLRRLVLGDNDAERFEGLLAERKERQRIREKEESDAQNSAVGDKPIRWSDFMNTATLVCDEISQQPANGGTTRGNEEGVGSASHEVEGARGARPCTPLDFLSPESPTDVQKGGTQAPSPTTEGNVSLGLANRDVRTPGPAPFRAQVILRDFMKHMEKDDGGAMVFGADNERPRSEKNSSPPSQAQPHTVSSCILTVRSSEAGRPRHSPTFVDEAKPEEAGLATAKSSPTRSASIVQRMGQPSHTQLLDWVAMRCQHMVTELLLIHEDECEEAREANLTTAASQLKLPPPPTAVISVLSKRPRNFVSDFVDGVRMAFVLLSVGVNDRSLADAFGAYSFGPQLEGHSSDKGKDLLSTEERLSLLQKAFDDVLQRIHNGSSSASDNNGFTHAKLSLTGSGCAKAIQTLFTHFQGTPVVGLREQKLLLKKKRSTLHAASIVRVNSTAFAPTLSVSSVTTETGVAAAFDSTAHSTRTASVAPSQCSSPSHNSPRARRRKSQIMRKIRSFMRRSSEDNGGDGDPSRGSVDVRERRGHSVLAEEGEGEERHAELSSSASSSSLEDSLSSLYDKQFTEEELAQKYRELEGCSEDEGDIHSMS